jgi:hypothetical protein
MSSKNLLIIVSVAVVMGLGGFGVGMKYQQSKTPQFSRRNPGNAPQQRFNGQGSRPVAGEILSRDDKSITVKLSDGSSKIVFFSGSTSINKPAEVTKTDLKVGDTVRVFGTANSDGSVTAQNIQVGPMLGNLLGGSAPVQK